MLKKDIVKNYVISLILGRHCRVGDQIPSEKLLARHHNCSRTSVRQALKELTCGDWIQPQKGRGYFVSNLADYATFFAKGAYQITQTRVRQLYPFENDYLQHVKIHETKHLRMFAKEYLRGDEIVIKTINCVKNAYLFGLKDEEVKGGFIQSLIKNNIAITHQNRAIKILNLKLYDQTTFDWKGDCPVIITSLYSGREIIERSIILIKKKHFKFQKKIVF